MAHRLELRRVWTLEDHFGAEGLLTKLSDEINAWYRRELEGDPRQHCIVRLEILNEHEVVVEHIVPQWMETGDFSDVDWLFDRNIKGPVCASFKFTPKEPPPFGMIVIEE